MDRRPDLEPLIYQGFLGAFARREEVAVVLKELRELRTEMNQRFERVDQRFKEVDACIDAFREEVNQRFERMDQHFDEVSQAIDRLGSRWGIRNESVFRRTMASLLEESFGAAVEERVIAGEQFDVVIVDSDQHILVEIAASVGASIQERLERKRRLYTEATGVAPARVLLATADIYSYRAQALREAGIEVIEPAEAD